MNPFPDSIIHPIPAASCLNASQEETYESLLADCARNEAALLDTHEEVAYLRKLRVFSADSRDADAKLVTAFARARRSKTHLDASVKRLREFERLGKEGEQLRKEFEKDTAQRNASLAERIVANSVTSPSRTVLPWSKAPEPSPLLAEAAQVLVSAAPRDIGPNERVRVVRAVVFEGTYAEVQAQIKASLSTGVHTHGKGSCSVTIEQGPVERVVLPSTLVEGY